MSEDAEEEWLTVPEAARRLGIGERKAYRHAAKLSDTDVRVSDTGQRLVRQSALNCLTEGRTRRAEAASSPLSQIVLGAAPVSQLSDSKAKVSDSHSLVSDSKAKVSDTARRPPDAEVQQIRRDNARLEDENRFMREQLAQAIAGWRDEQRRVKELEQKMKELPAPETSKNVRGADAPEAPKTASDDTERRAGSISGMETPPEATTGQSEAFSTGAALDAAGTGQGAGRASVTVAGNEKRTWWARLWGK